jgi:hypothetical protein
VSGFVGQTIGGWPHSLLFSFFRSC